MMEYVLHPRTEIDERIRRLQRLIVDMTGVIVLSSIDMGYFSGTSQDGLMYIPREGSPVVMVHKSLERAREESPLEVRQLKGLRTLREYLDLPERPSIGLELDVLPYSRFLRISHALGKDASLVDVSDKILQVRSVKSDFEIGLIRQAARILDAGISSIPEHLHEGAREIDVAACVERTMRVLGHQGRVAFRRFNQSIPMGHLMAGDGAAVPSFVSSPTGGMGMSVFFPQGPGFRKIRRGEPVLADFAGCYNGYIADETRIFCLGDLPTKLEDAHLAALQIHEAISRRLRPGETGRQLYSLSEAEGLRLGYGDYLGGPAGRKAGFAGHGVGLEIDEYPVIGPVDHKIAENMTIAIEPKMIFPDLGVVGVEDTFLTGSNSPERLTRLPWEIWRV